MSIFENKEAWAAVLLLSCAAPVAAFESGAALECRFETECFDAEGCDATDYTATLTPSDGGATLSDVAEDVPMQPVEVDGTTAYVGHANGALRLLTGLEGETARLSVHQAAGDLMLNYVGVCERAD